MTKSLPRNGPSDPARQLDTHVGAPAGVRVGPELPSDVRPGIGPALRPYQLAAVEAVLAARRAGKRRLLVHLPTGAGKTVIFSHLARLARRQVLVLAHREELLTQARDKLQRALGGAA